MIRFAYPLGFWLGLAAAGVILAHVVRRRARRRTVPFLPLWAAALAQQRGGLGSAIVRRLDLVLVLLACGAVAVAAGAPFVQGKPSTLRDLVLVLDGGVALRAGTRPDRMRKVGAAEIERRADGTRFVVVRVTDDGAGVWTGTDKEEAKDAVRAHRPGWTDAPPAQALDLARAATRGLRDADLVFCTHRRVDVPEGVRVRAVPENVTNAGIASLEVVGDPEGGGALARVGLRGQGAVEIVGHWSGEVDGRRTVDVPLSGSGRRVLAVRAEGDVFAPDDRAYLILPERAVPRVLVVAKEDASPFLVTALQALESTGALQGPLERARPGDVDHEVVEDYDLCVFDRCAPPARVEGLRALYVAPPGDGALPFRVGTERAAPALFDVASTHALLRGFDLARVVPLRARPVLGGDALATAAPGPVLSVGAGWIALGFDPDACILAASPAYPLFLRNCIDWLGPAQAAAGPEFHALGEPSPARGIATIEGEKSHVRAGETLRGPPGFWTAGDETFAVNFLAPDLDLRSPDRGSDPLPPVGRPGRPERSLVAAFAGAGIVLLLLAWWAFWRS